MSDYKIKTRKPPKGTHYDKERADLAVNFINQLVHVHGEWAGKPFNLMPWQEHVIRDIFGTIKADGYRQYTSAFIFTPKKNAKSELAAAVALYMLMCDGEYGAEVYGCAYNKDQASVIFKTCTEMVRMLPHLKKRIRIMESQKRLVYPQMNSFYAVVSSDAPSKHGINATSIIFDELLAQSNRNFYDTMTKGSSDARREPLTFILSTAGDSKQSICYEIFSRAKEVLAGKRDEPTFYPVLFGADDGDDWEDEKVWRKCNPSLGVTFGIDKLRQAYESAKGNPVEEKLFKQLRLNMWVESTTQYLPQETWTTLAHSYTEDDLLGRKCYGGLDLSSTTDLTAFVLVFPPKGQQRGDLSRAISNLDEKYIVLSYFWIPEDGLEKRIRRDSVRYDAWVDNEHVFTTPGKVVDYDIIEDFIIKCKHKFKLEQVALDRWNATQTGSHLTNAGLTVIDFGQGYRSLSFPTKELLRKIMSESIAHNDNDCQNWCLSNMVVQTDAAGNVKPNKEKSEDRIDGAVALIMALDICIKGESDTSGQSIYNFKDLLVI